MILCSKSILILPLLYFRLAFHDCLPYENGGGDGKNGCDGCLDFDENEDDHNVLQPTVAILVSLSFKQKHPSLIQSRISFS